MIAFYVMNATEFQDMLPMLIEFCKAGKKCWFCIIDSLAKKRQFYFYTKDTLVDFVKETLHKNKELIGENYPIISFYGQSDENQFLKDYERYSPEKIIVQNSCINKYPNWLPKIQSKKVINLCWADDSAETKQLKHNYLNLLKYEHDWDVFKKSENT